MDHIAGKKLQGIQATLISALFLGLSPVFGKQAMLAGLPWQAVVAVRTAGAAGLLLLALLLFRRRYIYIYPAGFLGCLLAGGINGVGSLFYYGALSRLDASVGQMLYALYPLFVALWLWLDHQPPAKLTLLRLAIIIPGVFLLLGANPKAIDPVGVVMMLVAAALYALHLPINQRVLYDMPSPTVTLYTLLAMTAVVAPAFFIFSGLEVGPAPLVATNPFPATAWLAVSAMTLATFLSRLLLFTGVKHLGGQQAALLGLSELLVVVVFAHLWLHESLLPNQWLGAALVASGLALVALEKPVKRSHTGGWLSWLRPPGLPSDFPWNPD